MTTQSFADIRATMDLVRLVRSRIDAHAEHLKNSDALESMTIAQRCLDQTGKLLERVPTIEDPSLAFRESIKLVEREKCGEVGRG